MRINKHTVAWLYLVTIILVCAIMFLAWKLQWVHMIYSPQDFFNVNLYRIPILIDIGWYFLTINAVSFVLFGIDKWIAIRNGRNTKSIHSLSRIPEFWLLGIAFIGGTIGSIIAMILFKHKINDWYFVWEIPMFLCLHVCLLFSIHAVGIF